MTYYKFIDENNCGYNGFDYTEYQPRDGQPGKPLPTVDGAIERSRDCGLASGR